jgi:hypothetical protein
LSDIATIHHNLEGDALKLFLKFLASVLIALALGLISALWAINSPPGESYNVTNGAWRTNLAIGSSQAGMYIRALVARTGLFALNKSETIYFVADSDDNGQPLHSKCNYRIEGKDIETRWWSITAYGEDHFLIANEKQRHSFNGHDVMRKADGTYDILMSPTAKSGNWLPSGNQKQLYLALRLYNPKPAVYENPAGVELPRITRGECR